jgi:hypothetical protein
MTFGYQNLVEESISTLIQLQAPLQFPRQLLQHLPLHTLQQTPLPLPLHSQQHLPLQIHQQARWYA